MAFAPLDHNLLWSFRLGLISNVFFGRTWSDLVGLAWSHLGLPRRSLTTAGGAELPLLAALSPLLASAPCSLLPPLLRPPGNFFHCKLVELG